MNQPLTIQTNTASTKKPPGAMTMIDQLTQASAGQFDAVYMRQQVMGHEKALSLHTTYGQSGSDPGLKAFAAETAPKVEKHLEQARALEMHGETQ